MDCKNKAEVKENFAGKSDNWKLFDHIHHKNATARERLAKRHTFINHLKAHRH